MGGAVGGRRTPALPQMNDPKQEGPEFDVEPEAFLVP